ncbi:Rmf/CrpP family protein [Sphingomonas aquatilis]
MGVLIAAFEDGRLSGLERGQQVSDCPFSLADRTRREAWISGFSVGRSQVAQIDPAPHWWRTRV